MKYFEIDDDDAWVKASERHHDIEEARRNLIDKLETVCPSQTKV